MGEGGELRARKDGLGFPTCEVARRDRAGEIREALEWIGRSRLFEDMSGSEAARRIVEVQGVRRLRCPRLDRGKNSLLLALEASEGRRHRLDGRSSVPRAALVSKN